VGSSRCSDFVFNNQLPASNVLGIAMFACVPTISTLHLQKDEVCAAVRKLREEYRS
jgi:hypothetical protein